MLGVNRVTRIAGRMQRSLYNKIARLVCRCCAADAMDALDEKGLAACSCDEAGRGQSAQAPADDNDVIGIRHILAF
jgi:hypothetical protein